MNDFKGIKAEVQRKLRIMKDTWWSNKANEIQLALDTNDTKFLYNLLHEVYEPSSSSISPLRSQDGNNLLQDPKDILKRWREHFDELLNRPSEVKQECIDSIPCSSVEDVLADGPCIEEVKAAVSKSNCGKAPGIDGLQAEIFSVLGLI